jgi:hypothetical protein
MSVTHVLSTENYIVVCLEDNTNFTSPFYIIQSQRYLQEAITAIADALNAPVLATDAVLAGLPKDAEVRTGNHSLEVNDKGKWGYYEFNENWEDEADFWVFVSIDDSDRIFSDRCPKTAEYLLQFTLNGVRRLENA